MTLHELATRAEQAGPDDQRHILDMVDRFRFESDADVFRLLDEIADQARAALALARGGA